MGRLSAGQTVGSILQGLFGNGLEFRWGIELHFTQQHDYVILVFSSVFAINLCGILKLGILAQLRRSGFKIDLKIKQGGCDERTVLLWS
ncbi:MAG TPA: hypothetical protein VJK04_01245 [Candidatus Paceibacterota bacterium]